MSTLAVARNAAMRVIVALVAVALVLGGIVLAVSDKASAQPNLDRLRPNCDWDPYGWHIQYCRVFSPAMEREIPVMIRASHSGGDAALYMLDGLHGYNPGASGWFWSGRAAQTFAGDTMTLVAPAAGDASFYTDWNAPAATRNGIKIQKWETFLTKELPVYLQREFGVNPNRNAIAGLSMGASAAVSLASNHRDQFKHVTALSGYYQISNPVVATGMNAMLFTAGVFNPSAMWGPPIPAGPGYTSRDVTLNLEKLRGLPMYVSSAEGVSNMFSDPDVLNRPVPQLPDTVWRGVMESISRASTQRFESSVRGANLQENIKFVYSPTGIHSWELWARDTGLARPDILRALNL